VPQGAFSRHFETSLTSALFGQNIARPLRSAHRFHADAGTDLRRNPAGLFPTGPIRASEYLSGAVGTVMTEQHVVGDVSRAVALA
jgi:hypothetical protein